MKKNKCEESSIRDTRKPDQRHKQMLPTLVFSIISGSWEAALRAAEYVLDQVPRNSKGILIKAESLFNLCQFELALVYFHRGQTINSPELGQDHLFTSLGLL